MIAGLFAAPSVGAGFIVKIDPKYAPLLAKLANKEGWSDLRVAPPSKDGKCWVYTVYTEEDALSIRTWRDRLKKAGF